MTKFKAIISIVSLALLVSACGSKVESSSNSNAAQQENVQVATAPAKVVNIPSYFEATGTLAGDAVSDVAPTIAGRIVAVNFDIGSYVNKGDVLVKLDDRDAQIRLDQALAQLDQQRKSVATAEANVDQAVANLRQAQVRLGLRDGESFDIKDFSQVISVTAQLELAEKEFRRAEKLLETGDISKSAYDQRKSQRDALIGQLAEARSNAAVAIRAINTAEAAVNTAETNVRNARAAVRTAETQVDQARKSLSDTSILAPFSGYVSEKTADVGEYLSPNAPNTKICSIVRTAVLRLKIDIPEQSIGKVSVGQGVSAQVSAYPDRKFAGTVARILPSLNAQSRTLTVEAEIENVGGLLKPGQFATVRITQSKPEPAVVVPASAVRSDGDVNKVFVVKDGVAQERFVKTGLLENDMIEIKQGVAENEVVATSSLDKLGDGMIVKQ
ncbi:MAG TPA: efflux RND transporter periplasmic adaptor subunit [Pyrinomonadaceae bacterium]|nr:efflux RND transporter periplasmic adaptor subunit [Pyrinomonadaceae bacterium]